MLRHWDSFTCVMWRCFSMALKSCTTPLHMTNTSTILAFFPRKKTQRTSQNPDGSFWSYSHMNMGWVVFSEKPVMHCSIKERPDLERPISCDAAFTYCVANTRSRRSFSLSSVMLGLLRNFSSHNFLCSEIVMVYLLIIYLAIYIHVSPMNYPFTTPPKGARLIWLFNANPWDGDIPVGKQYPFQQQSATHSL